MITRAISSTTRTSGVFEEAVAKQNVDVCFAGDSLTARGLWSEFFPDVAVSTEVSALIRRKGFSIDLIRL